MIIVRRKGHQCGDSSQEKVRISCTRSEASLDVVGRRARLTALTWRRMPRSGSLALAPEVDDLRRQFEQISADADALVTPLSDHQFNWRPASEAWSVAECVEHLNVTARMYLPKLDQAIADAISRGRYGEGPFRYSWLGRWFVRLQEPPAKVRIRAPKSFQPGPTRSRAEIMAAFRA